MISSPMFVISVLMRFSPWASCHAITQVRRAGSRVIMDCMDDPVADAQALVAERFPAARAAFLGGGVLSARRTMTSDLDIVVVIDGPPAPFRESLRWRGWPVELFVHRIGTTSAWFAKDVARRRPTLMRMCAGGVILADLDGAGVAIRAQAESVLAAGPPPVSQSELDAHRYGLTDLLDDLAGSTDPGETIVTCWYIVMQTAELALLTAGAWLGGGKWLLRELRQADLDLADELIAAIDDPVSLAAIADRVLDRAGGRLWAGYRQQGQL
ncbi:MAG TPA: nucleotidyltransferase domain-containing protein [Streptosporangiaceae bacterium]|nr:nucleotidyltransferase domain-containing protein [Streptosporangiaceae bacterium]